MNKIYFILTGALVAASTTAEASALKTRSAERQPLAKVARVTAKEAPDPDMEPIWEAPEGKTTLLSRSCDGFTYEAFEATHSRILGSIVTMVETEDGEVYLSNIASEYPCSTYIQATREGDTLTVKGPQAITWDYDEWDELFTVYLVPMEVKIDPETNYGYFNATEDMTFQFKIEEDGSIVAADPEMLLGVCTYGYDNMGEEGYLWSGFGDRDIRLAKVTDSVVTPPEDGKILSWVWQDEYVTTAVSVCIDGSDLYIAGMNRDLPTAWVKGTIEGDKVTFPSGQYLGPDYEIYYLSYFCGADFSTETDEETGEEYPVASLAEAAVFDYDAETSTLTSVNGYVINSTPDKLFPLYGYEKVTVGDQHRDVNAIPATPYNVFYTEGSYDANIWCQVPNTDVDGKLLDENKLFYEIVMDGEPFVFTFDDYYDLEEETSLIPYNTNGYDIYSEGTDKTVYLYTLPETSIGVRSVYINENGEYLYSEICYDSELTSAKANMAEKEIKSVEWFDVAGRRVGRAVNGIAIKVTKYADGSLRREKVIVR
jgi:hypothetical protein